VGDLRRSRAPERRGGDKLCELATRTGLVEGGAVSSTTLALIENNLGQQRKQERPFAGRRRAFAFVGA